MWAFVRQVIRNKLAHMARHVEATQALLELITFQMQRMPAAEAMVRLGGPIALLKVQCTSTFELCAREASQVLTHTHTHSFTRCVHCCAVVSLLHLLHVDVSLFVCLFVCLFVDCFW